MQAQHLLNIEDLQAGDIMLKVKGKSTINKIINVAQALTRLSTEDANIVHAGLLIRDQDQQGFEEFYVVEAQSGGLAKNRLLQDTTKYFVFRANNEDVRNGIATAAKLVSDLQGQNQNVSYSIKGAISSLFKRIQGNHQVANNLLDNIIDGQPAPMYCSQFVMSCLLFVHETFRENGVSPINQNFFNDINKNPAQLIQDLRESPSFNFVGLFQL
ncbi:MAG: hypothetical protein F6K40_01755 [Okeania sp. SIO3I5]|uniref:YiiX/YebB-like N1pC/P60 family cysteine hydrolase n=1 Tax=Okeania sp. SIO3I5 TaxID=2607805 RepID=UPI0013BCCA1E|nr:YiiX/YebB-like N1pC/P60 family cysteine hydrolase [Okeania sp. SIO3I5]NEQ35101.1 hypothetical protein [Okeania sp. SIO3I5]